MRAILTLQDGLTFEGLSIGNTGTTVGEVVFNTSMTGYQEMLTDPSYCGQILTFTYPLIGNYGVTHTDDESTRVQVAGLVVRELAEVPSNWRSEATLSDYLKRNNVVALQGVDTRMLTKHLRDGGVMMGAISTELSAAELQEQIAAAPSYDDLDFIPQCTVSTVTPWTGGIGDDPVRAKWLRREGGTPHRVALLDLGVKHNIMRSLAEMGCQLTAFPATTPASEILATDPDGIMISPGPGDPARLRYLLDTIRELAESGKPVGGICLGHQLLGHAYGGDSFKLLFGHRGGNHPVKDLATGRVSITSQNHGYALRPEGLEGSGFEVSHINLNDGTVEGLRHKELPVFSIQFHPEASPGPRDSTSLFEEFVALME
jgi:carbamoyl-phosphate synthase small subunit